MSRQLCIIEFDISLSWPTGIENLALPIAKTPMCIKHRQICILSHFNLHNWCISVNAKILFLKATKYAKQLSCTKWHPFCSRSENTVSGCSHGGFFLFFGGISGRGLASFNRANLYPIRRYGFHADMSINSTSISEIWSGAYENYMYSIYSIN